MLQLLWHEWKNNRMEGQTCSGTAVAGMRLGCTFVGLLPPTKCFKQMYVLLIFPIEGKPGHGVESNNHFSPWVIGFGNSKNQSAYRVCHYCKSQCYNALPIPYLCSLFSVQTMISALDSVVAEVQLGSHPGICWCHILHKELFSVTLTSAITQKVQVLCRVGTQLGTEF